MKRHALAVAVMAGTLSLAATACTIEPVAGTVVGKDFDRGYCTISTTTTKVGTTTVAKPKQKCTRDDYELQVRTDTGKLRWVDVDQYTYERATMGERYPK